MAPTGDGFASAVALTAALSELARLWLGRALIGLAAERVDDRDGRPHHHQVAAEVAQLLAGVTDARGAAARARELDGPAVRAWEAFARRLAASRSHPLARLVRGLALDELELQVIVAVAAAELDPAIARGYQVAGDGRVDVGWYATLVAGLDPARRLAVLAALGPARPLERHRLLRVRGDGALATRTVRLTDGVAAVVRGEATLDPTIAAAAALAGAPPLAEVVIDPGARAQVERALALGGGPPARVLVIGPDGQGKATLVAALAAAAGRATLRVELARLCADRDLAGVVDRLAIAAREAAARDAVLLLDDGDQLAAELRADAAAEVGQLLAEARVPVAVVATAPIPWLAAALPTLVEVAVPAAGYRERIALWTRALAGEAVPPAQIEALASRYGLGAAAIARAATRAGVAARLRDPARPAITDDDLVQAARATFANRLGAVAQRIPPGFTWDDLVLPADTVEQLREVVRFAERRPFLLEEWGFARKLPYGRGVSAILAGPPGTGKTMVAQLLAKALGYELYRIDLSQLVNKYVGETEKNLARVFAEAEHSHAVLFFDEADAMFAKRTDVKSANDRYANLEVNYLLQRMETFDGVTLLATNLEQGLDPAFKRRVRFSIQFELPDVDERRALWRSMVPAEAPLAPDVDWDRLAHQFEMAGGYIKKAVVRAALAAASATPPRAIAHADLARAATHEYREMGRVV